MTTDRTLSTDDDRFDDFDPEDAYDDADPFDVKLAVLERVVEAIRAIRERGGGDEIEARARDADRLVRKLLAQFDDLDDRLNRVRAYLEGN